MYKGKEVNKNVKNIFLSMGSLSTPCDLILCINPLCQTSSNTSKKITEYKTVNIPKISTSLQIIFNKFHLQCKYPTSWKIAHVIAIVKKGDN
jgi:hypothetical protein